MAFWKGHLLDRQQCDKSFSESNQVNDVFYDNADNDKWSNSELNRFIYPCFFKKTIKIEKLISFYIWLRFQIIIY